MIGRIKTDDSSSDLDRNERQIVRRREVITRTIDDIKQSMIQAIGDKQPAYNEPTTVAILMADLWMPCSSWLMCWVDESVLATTIDGKTHESTTKVVKPID